MSLRKAVNAKCNVPGCEERPKARGYCNAHYCRWRRTGDAISPRQRAPRGSGTTTSHGYRVVNGLYEHIVVAGNAFGGPLPRGAEVHHVNGDKLDNRSNNLVVCQDRAYHMLLHRRARALTACGRPDWLKCAYCGQWDDPANMYVHKGGVKARHNRCIVNYNRERRHA